MDHIDSYEVPQILSTQKPMGNQLNKELFFSFFFFLQILGCRIKTHHHMKWEYHLFYRDWDSSLRFGLKLHFSCHTERFETWLGFVFKKIVAWFGLAIWQTDFHSLSPDSEASHHRWWRIAFTKDSLLRPAQTYLQKYNWFCYALGDTSD